MTVLRTIVATVAFIFLAGCDRLDMYDQARYEALEASPLFADGKAARDEVVGTIARGDIVGDVALTTGKDGDEYVSAIPETVYRNLYERFPQKFQSSYETLGPSQLRMVLLERGRQRFDIFCSVCHSRVGDGNGMIVQRGFRSPPSYHSERLRRAADGHYFDVITHGFGSMPSYSTRIDVNDRWAIVVYIRALQLSQFTSFNDLSPDDKRSLQQGTSERISGEDGK